MKRTLLSFKSIIATALLSVLSIGAHADDVTLSSTTVGNADCSSGWWSAFSDNVNIPVGKALTFSFTNNTSEYSSGWKLYHNWVLVTSSVERGGTGYGSATEYFAIRGDNWGWGSRTDYPYSSANLSNNYADVLGVWDNTKTWYTAMQGANTTVEIQRLTSGRVYVSMTMITAADQTLTESYWQDCSADGNLYAFLTVENAYISNLKATLSDATIGVKTLASISVSSVDNVTHYFAPNATTAPFIKASAIVKAKYTDGTEESVPNSQVTFSETIGTDGKFTATYGGFTVNGVANVSAKTCSVIGATDFTSGFGAAKTSSVQVAKGQTVTETFQLRSDGIANWHGPISILHTVAGSEYGAFRLDNCAFLGSTWSSSSTIFGTLTSNWDWGNFAYNLDGSMVTLSVTNNGETIDVKYDVVDGGGVSHYQYFTSALASNAGSQADEDDVYFYITCENAYLLFEQSQVTAISSVKADSNVKVIGNEIQVDGEDFEVYSLNGQKVTPANLAHGIYIVRTPNAAQKVVIK